MLGTGWIELSTSALPTLHKMPRHHPGTTASAFSDIYGRDGPLT